MQLKGKVWTFGDSIDTDVIIPHIYLSTSDPEELVIHAFESIFENFYLQAKPGDIIVAGKNFGTGSSREEAVYVLKQIGIKAVIADSIARIYFRNLINLGIYAIQIDGISKNIKNGDNLSVDCEKGIISNLTTSQEFKFQRFPEYILNLVKNGGTINYIRNQLGKH